LSLAINAALESLARGLALELAPVRVNAVSPELVVVNARTDSDLETAFASFSQQRIGAVLIGNSTFFPRRMEQLAALAAFPYREYVLRPDELVQRS
jgi:NAD(P)-dependent dehydrogenase (short-subunit alcohol dehydrogenase family)